MSRVNNGAYLFRTNIVKFTLHSVKVLKSSANLLSNLPQKVRFILLPFSALVRRKVKHNERSYMGCQSTLYCLHKLRRIYFGMEKVYGKLIFKYSHPNSLWRCLVYRPCILTKFCTFYKPTYVFLEVFKGIYIYTFDLISSTEMTPPIFLGTSIPFLQ